MVKYGLNDGVPPHVDGKDATLLIYLNTVPEGSGGRTVFPEDGLAVPPISGTALLYKSKTELLHFSEPVGDPNAEKVRGVGDTRQPLYFAPHNLATSILNTHKLQTVMVRFVA